MTDDATALWIAAPGRAELRRAPLPAITEGMLRLRLSWSAVSRGTERLVFEGRVPASEAERMRCPLQEGRFPGPLKYGYAAVGIVEDGPANLVGAAVFSLAPHQDRAVIPAAMAVPLPEGTPPRRAALAANLETALTILWDAGLGPGDRVAVIGGGVVGLLAARLAVRIPGAEVTVVDVNPDRAAVVAALGVAFAAPGAAPRDCDVVIHASASAEGLATAIDCAGFEAAVVEASWYGDRTTTVPLGGAFHSRRLRIVGSQVGSVPVSRRARWPHRRRLETALALASDPALDALISGETAFVDSADHYAAILRDPGTLAHLFRY